VDPTSTRDRRIELLATILLAAAALATAWSTATIPVNFSY
jgi:hypothetical protein